MKIQGCIPSQMCDYTIDADVPLTFENYSGKKGHLIFWNINNERKKFIEITLNLEIKSFYQIVLLYPADQYINENYDVSQCPNIVRGMIPCIDMNEFKRSPETADPLPHEYYIKHKNSMAHFTFSLYNNAAKIEFCSSSPDGDCVTVYQSGRVMFYINKEDEISSIVFLSLKSEELKTLLDSFHNKPVEK